MQKTLKPAERLIVAADFKPPQKELWIEPGQYEGESLICTSKINWVRRQVLSLADSLKGTGVYLKVNSALRACGYDLIGEIQSRGLKVFADLKLYDVDDTLSTDGTLLAEAGPELLTVVCTTGDVAMKALKAKLTQTEGLGVTVLTSLTEDECRHIYGLQKLEDVAVMLAGKASEAGMDGVICAGTEAGFIRDKIRPEMTINTPAIRPEWAIVQGENQNPDRIMTPAKALRAGATRLVIGKPIMQFPDRREAVLRTIAEIASVMGN